MEEAILNFQQQLQQLAAALQQLNRSSSKQREKVLKKVRFITNFTGTEDTSINSFINNYEYYLNRIVNDEFRKTAVRTIFHEKIQGETKDAVINLLEPDNWQLIKQQLRLRYDQI